MNQPFLGFGKALPEDLTAKAQGIKLIAFDIDGVMTDGKLYYGPEGEALKAFNVKDGVGLKLLITQGVEVAVISAKNSLPLQKRMSDLGVQHFYPGTKDKLAQVQRLCQELSVAAEETAFVGDDVIDLKVLPSVGLFIAPSDAHPLVQHKAHYVTQTAGGFGVVREVADQLLGVRHNLEALYQIGMQAEFESADYKNVLNQSEPRTD